MLRVKEKKKAREAEILEVAARLFAGRGFHATRVQDIANALGMQKGSLYYYFSTKEELLAKVIEGYVEAIVGAIKAIVETGYSPTQKLILAIDEHLRLYQKHAHIYAIFAQENLVAINRNTAVEVNLIGKKYEALWYHILQEGIEQGEFQPDMDVAIIVKAILGMCNNTLVWYNPGGRLPIREVARIFTELVLKGVKAGSG